MMCMFPHLRVASVYICGFFSFVLRAVSTRQQPAGPGSVPASYPRDRYTNYVVLKPGTAQVLQRVAAMIVVERDAT